MVKQIKVYEIKNGKQLGQPFRCDHYAEINGKHIVFEFNGNHHYQSTFKILTDWRKNEVLTTPSRNNHNKKFRRNGRGTLIETDGYKYIGEWKIGKRHGQGTQIYSKRSKYVGEWKNDQSHGQGTYTSDGSKYVGLWKKNERDYGTLTYSNGDKYVGKWKDDQFHGQGTFISANGKIEKGIWKDSQKVG